MDRSDFDEFPGEYDPETGIYRVYHVEEISKSVSTLIVKVVAALTDTPATDLDPVYETINPDALNAIYQFNPHRTSGNYDDHVTFTYHNCRITVFRPGIIEIKVDIDS